MLYTSAKLLGINILFISIAMAKKPYKMWRTIQIYSLIMSSNLNDNIKFNDVDWRTKRRPNSYKFILRTFAYMIKWRKKELHNKGTKWNDPEIVKCSLPYSFVFHSFHVAYTSMPLNFCFVFRPNKHIYKLMLFSRKQK